MATCERPGVSPPRCSSVGDNLRHHVYFDPSLIEGLALSLRDTMAEDYDPTDLTLIEQAAPNALTDVIAYSADYGENGAAGWAYCPPDSAQGLNSSGHRWCRGQELHFNLNPRYDVYFADDESRDHVTCHELGHTLGLRHWGNPPQSAEPEAYTCMNANTADGPVTLHQIDIDHINAYSYDTRPADRRFEPWPGHRSAPSLAGWEVDVHAMELEHFASLAEMTRSADAVVMARVTGVSAGRVFGDQARAGMPYAAVTLSVSELLAGDLALPQDEVTLEIALFDGLRSLRQLRASILGDEAVFFLRSKGESQYYRLALFSALVLNASGRAAVTSEAPDFLADLDGLPFGEFVRRVETQH